MKPYKLGSLDSTRDAVLRCSNTTKMCTAVSTCGTGNDTATLNAENYEAVKASYSKEAVKASYSK